MEAIDRDLTYSRAPARLRLRMQLPYERFGLRSLLGLALLLIAWQGVQIYRRNRQYRREWTHRNNRSNRNIGADRIYRRNRWCCCEWPDRCNR